MLRNKATVVVLVLLFSTAVFAASSIDCSLAPVNQTGSVNIEDTALPNLQNSEFTVEAWVKSKTSTLNGGIFGRLDTKGLALYVKGNEPKLAIRRSPTSTDPIGGCTKLNNDSTDTPVRYYAGY